MPIFNYWPGRYATDMPNAAINAYLNFYSHTNRHMFLPDMKVTRTYKIWLPPGEPVVAGYAVEACWEPPLVTPVTNPSIDFPVTANQPEPYFFRMILNNGEPIVEGSECCMHGCDQLKIESNEWYGHDNIMICWNSTGRHYQICNGRVECDPHEEEFFSIASGIDFGWWPPGNYLTTIASTKYPSNWGEIMYWVLEFEIVEQ